MVKAGVGGRYVNGCNRPPRCYNSGTSRVTSNIKPTPNVHRSVAACRNANMLPGSYSS